MTKTPRFSGTIAALSEISRPITCDDIADMLTRQNQIARDLVYLNRIDTTRTRRPILPHSG